MDQLGIPCKARLPASPRNSWKLGRTAHPYLRTATQWPKSAENFERPLCFAGCAETLTKNQPASPSQILYHNLLRNPPSNSPQEIARKSAMAPCERDCPSKHVLSTSFECPNVALSWCHLSGDHEPNKHFLMQMSQESPKPWKLTLTLCKSWEWPLCIFLWSHRCW